VWRGGRTAEGSRWNKSLAKFGALGAESVVATNTILVFYSLPAIVFVVVGKNYTNVLQINTHALWFRLEILTCLYSIKIKDFVCLLNYSLSLILFIFLKCIVFVVHLNII
jgi:hypothetical protein